MTQPICVVSGVGPGTGSALVRRFAAGGYRVAMLARDAERLADLAKDVAAAKAYVCDVSDPLQVDATMDLIEGELGAPAVLIHNAVGGSVLSHFSVLATHFSQSAERAMCSTSKRSLTGCSRIVRGRSSLAGSVTVAISAMLTALIRPAAAGETSWTSIRRCLIETFKSTPWACSISHGGSPQR